jgi:(4S)-4-hydroxy-5-phosphonooxypentane-2,3-dione isomerase
MSFVVAAIYTARDGEAKTVLDALTKVTEPSRAEPGNITYRAHRSIESPNVFFIYEEYVNEAAFAAHHASAHFERYIKTQAWPALADRIVVRSVPLAG